MPLLLVALLCPLLGVSTVDYSVGNNCALCKINVHPKPIVQGSCNPILSSTNETWYCHQSIIASLPCYHIEEDSDFAEAVSVYIAGDTNQTRKSSRAFK